MTNKTGFPPWTYFIRDGCEALSTSVGAERNERRRALRGRSRRERGFDSG